MKKFLTANEAAEYLGVSRSSLVSWAKQELLDGGTTPGGHYRFTIEEIDSFASKRGLIIPEKSEGEKTKILVIEDDESFREFIRDALEAFKGYELRETVDGTQGALMTGTWGPDIIVLDIRMPNMNGLDFMRFLRENPASSGTKVIVASAHLSPELKNELENLNTDIILEKPVRLAKIIASVQKLANLELKE